MSPGGTDMLPLGTAVRITFGGDRVWSRGAIESMRFETGIVTEHRDDDMVVTFDLPCQPWFTGQLPVKAWGFRLNELQRRE